MIEIIAVIVGGKFPAIACGLYLVEIIFFFFFWRHRFFLIES